MSAETIARVLGGAYYSGAWWRCRCPAHGSSGASLALRDDPGGTLQLRCFAGCGRQRVADELRRRGLIDDAAAPRRSRKTAQPDRETIERQREQDARDRARRIAAARSLWSETEPANWLIETYLGGRLILCQIPETIRLHRALRHREAGCRRPAMVCAVEHATEGFVGVHVTYLAPNGEGKATGIEPVKRFIGPVGGGAVRLAPAANAVAVSEGVETGLSYQEATGIPTWAALSAGGIRSLILPDTVSEVTVAADPDPPGMIAARAAARRWLGEGRRVSIARPPLGMDFNDMALVTLG